jgi:hypothetical protein
MNKTHVRALMDGAGAITLFPDRDRPMGSLELHGWRMAGMTTMFVTLLASLGATVGMVALGVSDGWAMVPYVTCMTGFVGLQIRHARVPVA